MKNYKIFIKELQDSHSMFKIQIQDQETENPEIPDPKINSASKKRYNNLHRKNYTYNLFPKDPIPVDSFQSFQMIQRLSPQIMGSGEFSQNSFVKLVLYFYNWIFIDSFSLFIGTSILIFTNLFLELIVHFDMSLLDFPHFILGRQLLASAGYRLCRSSFAGNLRQLMNR